jgi:predicted XRE-type DNA-binding protein
MSAEPTEVHESTGNVFADLGLPDAEAHFLKAQIVAELYRLTTERNLSPAEAGAIMGIGVAEVSRLFKGEFREYPVEHLQMLLTTCRKACE